MSGDAQTKANQQCQRVPHPRWRAPYFAGAVLAVTLSGCRWCGDEPSRALPEDATLALDAAAPDAGLEVYAFAADLDEVKALASLAAVPAWQAVIDRGEYLARRDRNGVVWGVLSKVGEQYLEVGEQYLVDETQGQGALGIRLVTSLPHGLEAGARIAVRGSWRVDEQRRWAWQASEIWKLSGTNEALADSFVPGLAIEAAAAPAGASLVSSVEEAGPIVFQVVSAPVKQGDGWEIADQTKGPATATLRLPGSELAYGAQDYRGHDERWRLERGITYVVWVAPFRNRRYNGRLRLEAVNAPKALSGPWQPADAGVP